MGANRLAGLVVLGVAAFGSAGFAQTASPTPSTSPAPSTAPAALDLQVRDALQNCFQCHGPGGVSIIPSRPTIAGQHGEYVQRQLRAFKRAADEGAARETARETARDAGDTADGAAAIPAPRVDPVMEHMISGLPDRLIAPIADAISRLACDGGAPKAKPAKPPRLPEAATPCVMCHGVDGIGAQTYIPNIAGQQRSYLRRQLLLIRETAWGAQPREGEAWRSHPIMEAQAARLKIADIDAVARYYAQLDCRGGDRGAGAEATETPPQ